MTTRSGPTSRKYSTTGRGNGVPASRPGTASMTPEGRERGLSGSHLLKSDPGD